MTVPIPPRPRRVLTDRQRRRLRWWLMLGLIPVALAVLVVSTKLISVSALSQTAVDRFESRAYGQAAEAARGLELWNWVEPWKAPFSLGVSLTMGGELEQGRAKLEESLRLHGEPVTASQVHEHCVIVASLATAIEKQGDAAREGDDREGANAFYNEALALIGATPEGCHDEPREGEADTAAQLEAAVPRIEEKIEDPEQGEGEGEGEGNEPQTPEEQLEEQNQGAQTEQQQQDQYDQGGDEPGGGSDVERPW
ncbi:hypothetical protein [Agrococcus sp. Marseille-Q4369]|uniref:hypothetical protein n=1 Tax=Agrococcus sp. Marseille-Q4369 TaxID=2810513 RepID=UPI001B8BF307|nr:hypothetical protein [Agrococcus sp. Marseille-Q4369]QUW19603.1 hypothetical protein JSQ78_04700 [Agrococcus sp. Marseille-Q4369]